jgi:hypothetical protein
MAIHNETMTIDKVGGMELQGHKGDKRTDMLLYSHGSLSWKMNKIIFWPFSFQQDVFGGIWSLNYRFLMYKI